MLLVAYVLLRDASVVNTRAAQQTVQGTENWISCQTHDECGAMEEELHFHASAKTKRVTALPPVLLAGDGNFCRHRDCALPEGFSVTCGVCEDCSLCHYNQYAIDRECPRWCGPSPMDTSHLAGLFISIPAVPQQELSGGQGGCLDIWRFEGSIFQLYRTGLCAPRVRALRPSATGEQSFN